MKRSKTGKDALLQNLRERIASHQLPPGSKLSEQQLAEEFGVSRTQIRDVFANLEQRGLIKRTPNKGAIVSRLDLTEVFDIYAVREVLEGLCARLATQKAPPAHWDDLIELFGTPMADCVKRGDLEQFVVNLELLRGRIMTAAENPVLFEMLDSIRDKMREIGRRVVILPGRAEQGLKEHRELLSAMRSGDAQSAERLRRENVRSACEFLSRYQRFVL
jgi:DNA-binding GntR family transcriptional regulator